MLNFRHEQDPRQCLRIGKLPAFRHQRRGGKRDAFYNDVLIFVRLSARIFKVLRQEEVDDLGADAGLDIELGQLDQATRAPANFFR